MTTLVAVGFPYATTAGAAAQDMLVLDPDVTVAVDSIALISCDARGQFQVTTNHRSLRGESRGLFWMLLFTALFFVPVSSVLNGTTLHDLGRRVEAAGVSESFQIRARELLRPDTSALFLVITAPLPVEAMEALGRFGGKVLATSLRDDAETHILHAVCPALR